MDQSDGASWKRRGTFLLDSKYPGVVMRSAPWWHTVRKALRGAQMIPMVMGTSIDRAYSHRTSYILVSAKQRRSESLSIKNIRLGGAAFACRNNISTKTCHERWLGQQKCGQKSIFTALNYCAQTSGHKLQMIEQTAGSKLSLHSRTSYFWYQCETRDSIADAAPSRPFACQALTRVLPQTRSLKRRPIPSSLASLRHQSCLQWLLHLQLSLL